uniref:Sigma non-opioid intracellular receptor 1 n=1 Tax=Steinernema glaseri TaxID=37863 RepID=A0A1I8A8I8_9BILA
MAFFITKTVRNLVILMIILSATQQFLVWKSYTISPRKFREVSVGARGDNALAATGKFINDLKNLYPSKINSQGMWVPISAGGAQLSLSIIYASLTEYVVLFHAPAQTWGRSGLHWSNSSCTVLSGSVNRFADTGLLPTKESFVSGGNFRHGQFESALYGFGQDTVVTCYGRGVTPVSGFWLSSGYAANADILNFAKLNYLYFKSTYEHFAYELAKLFDHYKSRVMKSEL